jgi:hypothetical protein
LQPPIFFNSSLKSKNLFPWPWFSQCWEETATPFTTSFPSFLILASVHLKISVGTNNVAQTCFSGTVITFNASSDMNFHTLCAVSRLWLSITLRFLSQTVSWFWLSTLFRVMFLFEQQRILLALYHLAAN